MNLRSLIDFGSGDGEAFRDGCGTRGLYEMNTVSDDKHVWRAFVQEGEFYVHYLLEANCMVQTSPASSTKSTRRLNSINRERSCLATSFD